MFALRKRNLKCVRDQGSKTFTCLSTLPHQSSRDGVANSESSYLIGFADIGLKPLIFWRSIQFLLPSTSTM
jgi:hypothetical protein